MEDSGQKNKALEELYSLPVSVNFNNGEKGLIKGNESVVDALQSGSDIVKNSEGSYQKLIPGVSLDKTTGKITISVPQAMYKSSDFNEMYGDGSILKQLSATYQADPNAKVALSDGRKLTIEEMVAEWDKGIKDLDAEVKKNIIRRDQLAAYDKRAKTFNDDQTRIASYSAINQGDTKASDTDRQYIPKWLLNTAKGAKIAKLPSWDAKSGTVERKDLLDWWTLGNFSRDEMIELKGKAEVNIKWGNWSDEDQYEADEVDNDGNVVFTTTEDNLSSKTEMAKTISFLRFIVSQDPEGNIFEKVGSTIESINVNFAMNFAEAYTGTMAALETGAAFITDNLDTWKYFTDRDQAMKDATSYYNEAMALASDSAVAIGQIAGVGGQITGHIALAWATGTVAGWAGEAAGAIRGAAVAKGIDAATRPLYATANALFRGGAVGVEEFAQMANTLSAGSRFLTSALATSGKLAGAFNQAVSIARAIKNTPLVGTAIEFLSDTIIDATISNPEAMRTLLKHVRTGEVSKKDYNYAMQQFGDNLKGWAAFRGAALGLKGVLTKTTLGKAANLKVSQFLTKLDNWAYDKDQAFKARILGKSVIESLEDKLAESTVGSAQFRRVQNKLNTAKNNTILRKFKETFASGKNWDAVLDQMEKNGTFKKDANLSGLKKYIKEATVIQNNIKAWNSAIDNMRKGVTMEYVKLMDPTLNPLTSATNDAITDWISEYQKVEGDVEGLTYDQKHTTMSVEASNYLGYSLAAERETVRANNLDLSDEVRKKASKNVEIANAKVEEMREILGADATAKLDEALPLYRNEYAALNAFAASPENGFINTIQLDEFDDMDLWGEEGGYIRTQRVMEDSGVRITSETGDRTTRPVIETQFREFTGERNFVDFEQTRASYRSALAEAAYQKSLLQTYMLNGQSTVKTYISAEETERVRKLGEVKLEYEKQAAEIASTAEAKFNLRSSRKGKALTDAQYNKAVYGLGFDETQDIILNYADTSGWAGGDSLVDGYTGSSIRNLNAEEKVAYWDEFKENLNDEAIRYLETRGVTNIDDLDNIVRKEGSDFINDLNQAYIYGDKGLRNSEVMKNIARNKYNSRADVIKDLKLAKTKEVLSLYDDQLGENFGNKVTNGMVDYSEDWIDDVIAKSDEQWAYKKVAAERASILGAEEDLTREYTVLETIQNNSEFKKNAYAQIDNYIDEKYIGVEKGFSKNDITKLKDEAHEVFDATLQSRIDNTKAALLEKTTDEALRRDVFKEVSDLDKKIRDAKNGIGKSVRKQGEVGGLILATDDKGRKVVYQVDPVLADIYNRKQQITAREANLVAKANYAMSKMFRLGTTTVNLTSFGNQFFKDTGDGIIVGGMWDTLKNNSDNFRDIYGDDVIEQMQAFSPYEATSVEALAQAQGISIEEALKKRELRRAELIADSSSEVQAYKAFRETVYGGGDNKLNVLQKMDNKVQEVIEAIDSKTNGIRERYIRKNVYMSNLNDALSNGYTISQARTTAEFAARNATTNFGRTLYHLQNISESTPYFAAAINGTKSFWRMFELDPVGITGRLMGGLVLPIMYLTAQSLATEENAKIYKNLPEYEREGNLTFVTNGQVFQIPLPEQLTSLVSPFRQFVEYLHGANKSTFWKLAANDLLGLSPIDLQGFSDIDFNDITRDPTPLDMMGRGFSRLFSQVAPVPLKSAYMGFTGIDPYTGKQIQSTTNMYYDEASESVQVMDYTQNMFARSVAALFGSDNPKIIEKVTSSIIGNTGVDVLGAIFGAVAALRGEDPYSGGEYTGEQFWNTTAEQVVSRATAPVTGPNYNQVASMWSAAIKELSAKKQAILNSKEVKAITDKLNVEKDPEKRQKLVAQRQNYKDEFDNDVKNTIKNLLEKYGGTFDRHKYGAVLQLLNFNTDTGWANATALSQELHSDLFYEGRNQAIQTMVDMGVSGVTDTSMFGYYTTNLDGEVVLKYNSPLAILNAKNQWYGRRDIDSAAIKNTLETSMPNLNQERSDMWARVKAANGYDAKDEIREEWNEKILGGIMPYIADLSTDQILDNDDVINYLEGYIQVPSWYEKVNNRYISSGYDAKTGTYKLDKNKAFIESYLRTVLEKR